jgi:hypothetical protein
MNTYTIQGIRYAARWLRRMQLTPETYPYWSQRHAFADWLLEEADRLAAEIEMRVS